MLQPYCEHKGLVMISDSFNSKFSPGFRLIDNFPS